ncbi:MAG: L-threonylcarbamoyladenylate synthase [Bacteroidota bacterium]|nr:L-threonylcarbamoyladenylate synthase [Bacteroidota bacterium]
MQTTVGKDIGIAKQLLESGELVAIPTETVYGLAANAFDARAVAKIFEVKNRPRFDPLILHAKSVDAIKEYVIEIPEWARKLSEAFMPGPMTIVLAKNEMIPDIVTSGLDTVGIRVPHHQLLLELLRQLDFPLAAPRANPFGYVSPTNSQHVYDQLNQKIPYILDGGVCSIGIESTIVGESDGKPVILRLGGTAVEDIWRVIGECDIEIHSTSNPINPGKLEHHYAPNHRLIFGTMDFEGYSPSEIGIISFQKEYPGIPREHQITLSPTGDLKEAAQKIFSAMRILDAMNLAVIFAEHFPDIGLGRAINDRLKRAAAVKSEA